jgi:microcystin-dependent protein
MPLIVPNATDIGTLFGALDQAEPDALDFQILGDRSTGVLSGCAVSASSGVVSVTEGHVAIQGVVHDVSSISPLGMPTPPTSTNTRFDLVVARLSGSSTSIVVVQGPESTTNPTFPPTPSRMSTTTGVNVLTYVNPATDVVLAAIFRNGSATITNSAIVDKRVNVPSTTSLRGDNVPSSAIGSNGDFYYKNTVGPSSSGVYVKRDGSWVELILQSNTGSVTPIGAIIMWPSTTAPDPTFWKECNGQLLSKSTYGTLFGLLGTTYGAGTSTQFALPDLNNKFVRGSGTPGSTGGADSVTLGTTNLPAHTHTLANHTHGIGTHTHAISLPSSTVTTSLAGAHAHQGDSSGNNVVVRLGSYTSPNYLAGYSTDNDGLIDGLGVGAQGGMSVINVAQTQTAGSHDHTVTITVSGNTQTPTSSPTEGPSVNTSGSTGNDPATAFSVLPSYTTMRWFIRVL